MPIWIVRAILMASALIFGLSAAVRAGDVASTRGRVNNLKVLSDKVDDVTTVENIVRSFAKPGMTDQDRSEALWKAVVKYRHQTAPPNEFLAGDWEAHDPVKIFNVYGYCMCCCTTALIEALNRADGREARGRILTGHSVPEVRYGDGWHMFDASLITVFPKPGNGSYASVDEIGSAIKTWYEQNPEYRGNPAKVNELMRSDGWMGWKSKGPGLLASCPYYRAGFFPARTHGWNNTMSEYDRESAVYEYGYHVGHRALFSLRPGESLVREAGNRGLHINMDRTPKWDMLSAKAPQHDLVYVNEFFPGYKGGVVGNGVHRYAPNLAAGDLALGAEVHENLAAGGSPALHLKASGRPGLAVIELASPYVYLGGRLHVKALRQSAADKVSIAISTNNGRDYVPLWTAESNGTSEATVDLKKAIFRRYAYWLKIEITASSPQSAGLESLAVENDIQHAPRTLPMLGQGKNTITVAADTNPVIASRAIACKITPNTGSAENESTGSMGITFENLDVKDGACWWKGGIAAMTVPVEVPGDLVALRFCAAVRARGARDVVKMLVSSDGGATYTEAGRIVGPTQGKTGSFVYDTWPKGTHKALLRMEMTGDNTIGVQSFRVDADYRDPLAAPAVQPFEVVHRWTENGRERSHSQPIKALPTEYTIDVAAEPDLTAVSYTMPASP
jgi:hypothetical protein